MPPVALFARHGLIFSGSFKMNIYFGLSSGDFRLFDAVPLLFATYATLSLRFPNF